MTRRLQALVLVAALAGAGPAAAASDYIFDIAKRDPGVIRIWSAIVPPAYGRHAWIKKLEGTTFPVESAQVGGKAFYLGAVCKPHDCGGNSVVFLIATDDSRAYGLLSSQTLSVAEAPFGKPDPEALAIMRKYMKSH